MQQILGTIAVTIGILSVTAAEGLQRSYKQLLECEDCSGLGVLRSGQLKDIKFDWEKNTTWIIGILMLLTALILSSLLGHLQEWSYKTYGKNWKEGLFYTHLFGLPYFLFLYEDIAMHIQIANQSPPLPLLQNYIAIPSLWANLMLNVFTQ